MSDRRSTHYARRFVEVMEAAEVPLSTIQLIIGHARQSLALDVYSKGQRVQLREAINKLHYAKDVMRLIRKPTTQEDKTPKTTEKRTAACSKEQKPADSFHGRYGAKDMAARYRHRLAEAIASVA